MELRDWLTNRAQQNRSLYELHGKPLEKDHRGKYVAISDNGQVLLGRDSVEVLQQAVKVFGSGNFALARVGYRTFGQWLRFHR